jgi:hypothetical protein
MLVRIVELASEKSYLYLFIPTDFVGNYIVWDYLNTYNNDFMIIIKRSSAE